MVPLDFYLFAQWLLDNRKEPAGYRSVISRAYYAAFLTARDFLLEASVAFPKTVSRATQHQHVPDLLEWSEDADIEGAAQMLRALRDQRNTADYVLDEPSIETEAEAQLRFNDAGTIISRLHSCRASRNLAGGRHQQVAASVRARATTLYLGPSP